MNAFGLQIFTELLHSEEAWDKKTRELRYHWVLEQAYIYRYALYEPVQTRLYQRAVHLCHVLTGLAEEDYLTISQDGVMVEYFADDCLTERFCGGGNHNPNDRISYIESIWYGTFEWALDMSFEVPTRQELLELGIRPNLVPSKENQHSLF